MLPALAGTAASMPMTAKAAAADLVREILRIRFVIGCPPFAPYQIFYCMRRLPERTTQSLDETYVLPTLSATGFHCAMRRLRPQA